MRCVGEPSRISDSGDTIPAPASVARPAWCASTSSVRAPRCTHRYAADAPTTPPPTMTTSCTRSARSRDRWCPRRPRDEAHVRARDPPAGFLTHEEQRDPHLFGHRVPTVRALADLPRDHHGGVAVAPFVLLVERERLVGQLTRRVPLQPLVL